MAKKTQEQFIKEVYDIYKDEYSVIGQYKNNKTKIQIRHNICGKEWGIKPNNFLNKHGCPNCFRLPDRRTTEEFKLIVFEKYENEYEVVGDYVNSHTKIEMKHNVCGNEWNVKPYSFLNGRKCPVCARKKITDSKRRTHLQFEKEVYDLVGSEYSVIGEYKNASTKIKMKHNCKKCDNNEWEVTPNDFINNGSRCPVCKEYKGEKSIRKFLLNNNIPFVSQKSYDNLLGIGNKKLSYDFYLPNNNILIEYQGEFHDGTVEFQTEEQFKIQQEHDKRKKQYAINNNINFLEIWYWDYNNIEEILTNHLNLQTNKIN